jgi:hypothetical protein
MLGDELTHLIKQAAAQMGETKPFLYGHISSYDPTQHRVRCVIPSMTDTDGNPTLSPWMPMLTPMSGAGYGVQSVPFGGATLDDPTKGEQVLIGMFDRQRGVAAVLGMFYHGTNPPPASNLPSQNDGYQNAAAANSPGDLIISAPPQTDGGANSFIRLRQNGNIEVWAASQANINVLGDVNLTIGGNATATVTGDASVTAATVTVVGSAIKMTRAIGDALHTLCTDVFQVLFNSHTHLAGDSPTSPPLQPADATTMTTVLTAE